MYTPDEVCDKSLRVVGRESDRSDAGINMVRGIIMVAGGGKQPPVGEVLGITQGEPFRARRTRRPPAQARLLLAYFCDPLEGGELLLHAEPRPRRYAEPQSDGRLPVLVALAPLG